MAMIDVCFPIVSELMNWSNRHLHHKDGCGGNNIYFGDRSTDPDVRLLTPSYPFSILINNGGFIETLIVLQPMELDLKPPQWKPIMKQAVAIWDDEGEGSKKEYLDWTRKKRIRESMRERGIRARQWWWAVL